jgi:hypothetical protein
LIQTASAFDLIVEGPRLAAFVDFQKQVEESSFWYWALSN